MHEGNLATVFVTKFNAAGNALVYSTYLGGSHYEEAFGIAVDKNGNAIVTGETQSEDFPTVAPFQEECAGGPDAFVTKLNPQGNGLVYSSFLGGSIDDLGRTITVDGDGNAYVAGKTLSSDFPKKDPYQDNLKGFANAFITKISPTGILLYSTYLGGEGNVGANAMALDAAGNIWIAGDTSSADFPLRNPYQSTPASCFVAQLKADGSDLLYSTYLGGNSYDNALGLAIDGLGNICVSGATSSTDFPLWNAFQSALGGLRSAFVTKFTPDGQALVYSTYLGGSSSDWCPALAADQAGNVYVCGSTPSPDFPTRNPIQKTYGGGLYDAFVTKFNPTGVPVFSTFLGGSNFDYANGIAVDRSGNIYVAGYTGSSNFPKVKPYQGTMKGQDAFVTKIAFVNSGAAVDLLLLLD